MTRRHRCQHDGCQAEAHMALDADTHAVVRWWCSQHVTDVPAATGRAGVVRYDRPAGRIDQ